MTCEIAVLRGDGIGPEVIESALSVLGACIPVRVHEGLVGGAAIDATGDPLPPETLDLCKRSGGVLLGAVGGPRWEGAVRAEDGLLRLRQGLGLFANLRPARFMGLPTPLREGLARQADIMVVRELSGGVYFGEPRGLSATAAFNTWRQTADEVKRVAHLAFALAHRRRNRVTSVDKANVLETSRLWRTVVTEVAKEHPGVELEHRYVDAASFELLQAPRRFDVVLTENLFGDILSDELAAVSGSIGVLPSASFGDGPSLYEPVHGSAPDLAGRGRRAGRRPRPHPPPDRPALRRGRHRLRDLRRRVRGPHPGRPRRDLHPGAARRTRGSAHRAAERVDLRPPSHTRAPRPRRRARPSAPRPGC